MQQNRRSLLIASLGALTASAAADAAMLFTDAAAFDAALNRIFVESFESVAVGEAPSVISFGADLSATVITADTLDDRVVSLADGYGAIASDGERFWKLRGGSATISVSGAAVNAFGFQYSDLEAATLRISAVNGAFAPFDLDDDNPNTSHFIGVVAGSELDAVRIEWLRANGDGIGVDALRFGATAVIPAPRSASLGLAGMLLFAVPRRRQV